MIMVQPKVRGVAQGWKPLCHTAPFLLSEAFLRWIHTPPCHRCYMSAGILASWHNTLVTADTAQVVNPQRKAKFAPHPLVPETKCQDSALQIYQQRTVPYPRGGGGGGGHSFFPQPPRLMFSRLFSWLITCMGVMKNR